MRIVIVILAGTIAATTCLTATSQAGSLSVRQANRANIYGSVQAGGHPSSIDVEQRGEFNMVGIVQASPSARASVYQQGRANVTVVHQTGSSLSRSGMP